MRVFLLLILIVISLPTFSQGIRADDYSKKAEKLYQESGEHLAWERFDEAIQVLQEAVDNSPAFTDAWHRLAQVYKLTNQHDKAFEAYQQVQNINPQFSRYLLFDMGEAKYNAARYNEAKTYFSQFLTQPSLPPEMIQQAKTKLASIAFAEEAVKNPVPFEPVNLGPAINSEYWEYLPLLTADQEIMLFTRRITSNMRIQEDFYFSNITDTGWQQARNLGPPINTPYNEGAHSISPDGRYLFFTGCERPDGFGSCDIFISERRGDNYSPPSNLGRPVNTPVWESQPSISPDGKSLYFVSNRRGGYGKKDIWVSNFQLNGRWSEPVNLGPQINTAEDEMSPFIHTDNSTIYFTSSGHIGMGGNDIFMSRRDPDGKWGKPENLGYPINTPQDDNGLYVATDGKTAYFDSKRFEGYGGVDIYSFVLPEEARPTVVTYVKGRVYDAETGRNLYAWVEVIDLATGEQVNEVASDEQTGEFLITLPTGKNYAYHVTKPGYLMYSKNFSLKEYKSDEPFLLDIPMNKIKVGEKAALRNIFFETDSYALKEESKIELNRLIDFLEKNNKVRIEVGGHTDNVGTDAYNLELSRNRAKSVYDYLVNNGIAQERLTYKGYGETKPVASNETEERKLL